jgi:hypothetical protein
MVKFRWYIEALILECKVIHHREYRPELIEDLCRAPYLPVDGSTTHFDVQGIHLGPFVGIYPYRNALIKCDPGTVESEILCCGNKVQEVWNWISELDKE